MPINLYNDKLFATLTFIFVLVGLASCANLLLWIFGVYGYAPRYTLVKDLVRDANNLTARR